jgi:hypothetical protein
MFTIFDLIRCLSPLFGLLLGGGFGSELGIGGAIAGGLLGGAVGLFVGRLPILFLCRGMRRKLASFSAEELRAKLHDPGCWTPNFLLLELKARGQDIGEELPFVLSLMESEHGPHRTRGYAALLSAFPDVAKALKGYNPTQSTEKCRGKIAEFKQGTGQ